MILINENIPTKILDFLSKKDDLRLLPDLKNISDSTKRHIDLGCVKVDEKLVCCPEFYKRLKDIPNTVCGEKNPEDGYPADILYNAVQVGNRFICLEKAIDKKVAEAAKELKIIKTKQGYAKCNIVPVGSNAIITEDENIAAVAEKEGISVLKIEKGCVFLDGYSHGFIGGAAVRTNKEIIFIGDISAHPDFFRILSFCDRFGIKTDFIKDFPLTDVGSPLFQQNV